MMHMKRIMTVVGARPQFVKASALSRVLRNDFTEILVHTGQHYDETMSDVFFQELEIPIPDINLGVGSGEHGYQTGMMLIELEKAMLLKKPDLVLLYGDTNSTLAGALAASKLHIKVAHVEAGLRSFDREMPEEINRILTDVISDILFIPTETARGNLKKEGITNGVYNVGDVMLDVFLRMRERALSRSNNVFMSGLSRNDFSVMTLHRPRNTDNPEVLRTILRALMETEDIIAFPAHPRVRKNLASSGLMDEIKNTNIRLLDPLGYLDFVALMHYSKKIITDSGGVQKEAYFLKKPCITIRENTEWTETVFDGWNVLVGHSREGIIKAVNEFQPDEEQTEAFGDGNAAGKILKILKSELIHS